MDCSDKLFNATETGVTQGFALKNSEPYFDLVEPTRTGGRKVKGDIRMCGKPVIIFLVGIDPVVGIEAVVDKESKIL